MPHFARHAVAAALRRYPFLSGAGRLASTRVAQWAHGPITDSPIEVPLRDGSTLLVNPRDPIGRVIACTGDFDRKITRVIRQILRPGDTFVDIGANCGVYAIQAARIVGGSGRVHAFEPQPELAAGLRNSARRNGFHHVEIHACALSDHDGEENFWIPHANTGGGRLAAPGGHPATTRVQTTDARRALEQIGQARVVKIDVEGHEGAILSAARTALENNPPDAVLFESFEHRTPFFQRSPVRVLDELGYGFLAIPRAIRSLRLQPIRSDADLHPSRIDYLALAQTPDLGPLRDTLTGRRAKNNR